MPASPPRRAIPPRYESHRDPVTSPGRQRKPVPQRHACLDPLAQLVRSGGGGCFHREGTAGPGQAHCSQRRFVRVIYTSPRRFKAGAARGDLELTGAQRRVDVGAALGSLEGRDANPPPLPSHLQVSWRSYSQSQPSDGFGSHDSCGLTLFLRGSLGVLRRAALLKVLSFPPDLSALRQELRGGVRIGTDRSD